MSSSFRPNGPWCTWTPRSAEPTVAVVAACPPPAHAGPGRAVPRDDHPASRVRRAGGAPAAAARSRAQPAAAAPGQRAAAPEHPAGLRGRDGGAGRGGRRVRGVQRTVDAAPGPVDRDNGPGRRHDRGRAAGALHLHPAALGTAADRHGGRGAAGPLAAGRGAPDRDRAPARLLPRPGASADHGGAQPPAEPARRASGQDVRRGHRVRRRTRIRAGRPAAEHQLAGQHPARAAAGEYVRRRALAGRGAARRRHVRRGRAGIVRP
jgi:hypothetical protein